MNPNAIASYALISQLKQLGVTTAVVSPGSRSLPIAFAANEMLDVLVVIDERDAGFCALGIAESTRNPVVVITTSGSAPTHLFPSVTESFGSSVPLIIISSDRPHEVRGRGAPQTIDQIELFSTHVRYFVDTPCPSENSDPNYWAGIGAELFKNSMGISDSNSCPGPVHLNMGFSEPLVPDGDEETFVNKNISKQDLQTKPKNSFGFSGQSSIVSNSLNREVGTLIANAKQILFTVGRSTSFSTKELNELEEIFGLPVLADVTSGLRHDSRIISHYDLIMRTNKLEELLPDLIIQVGEPLTSKKFNEWIVDTKIISVKPFEDGRNPYGNISEVIIADNMIETVSSLVSRSHENLVFNQLWSSAEVSVKTKIDSTVSANAKSEPALFYELGQTLKLIDSPLNVMLGSSMPIRYSEWFWGELNKETRVFSHRGTNGIDGIISSTLGIAYGTNNETVCVCGDVTFAHDVGFLSHCATISNQLGLKVIFVVVDNEGGAIFKHLKQGESEVLADSYNKLVATPTSLNFEALALASGAKYKNIDISDIQSDKIGLFGLGTVGTTVLHAKVQYDSGYEFMKVLDEALSEIL